MKPTFFPTPAHFRRWLERHHTSETELWVGFYKKATGRPTITWAEAVDEALCFGWIDGIRKKIDEGSYTNRFTPRRRGSNWSTINTRRAQELISEGRMQPAGVEAFQARDPKKSGVYSFEQRKTMTLDRPAVAQFKRNREAWSYFQSQPPGYQRQTVHWILSAKQEETRARRLQMLIDASAAGRRVGDANASAAGRASR